MLSTVSSINPAKRQVALRVLPAAVVPFVLALSALLVLASCSLQPVAEQSSNWTLTDTAETFESRAITAAFQYPSGWVVEEAKAHVYLAESREFFPLGVDYFASPPIEPYYVLYEVSPYHSLIGRLAGRTRSPVDAAREIARTYKVGPVAGSLLEPISDFTVAGKNAAALATEADGKVDYMILVALEPRHIVVVSGFGPRQSFEEMKDVVGAIAGSLRIMPNQ